MKKFYTVLAAAAVVVSASALNLNVERAGQLKTLDPSHKAIVNEKKVGHDAVSVKKVNKGGMRMVKANAGESTSIEGTWMFQFGDYYFKDSMNSSFTYNMTATVDGSVVYFQDSDNYILPFAAIYNETASTLTFPTVLIGTAGTYYIYQEPYVYNYTTQDLDFQNVVAKYTGNTIEFEADNGISWGAYTDEAGTNFDGYFDILDLEGATRVGGGSGSGNTGGEESDGSWSDMGEATLIDGWVLPAFGLDQTQYAYKVPLQCSNETPGLYRLVDPYHNANFYLAAYNKSSTKGYIVFDVSDPEHVVFLKSDAGFAFTDLGITRFYCYNVLGMFAEYYGDDPAEIVAEVEQSGDEIPFTTFKDGVVELNYIEAEDGKWYDANFGYQSDPTGGFAWQTQTGESVDMSAKIIFPEDWAGVKNVTVAETNAPVEYFNLQGVRVANPESGLYIRRQGNSVSKVQVK